MSGRSCSEAWAVFFARDGVAGEEAADRPVANPHAFVRERLAQLFDRDVGRRFDKREDRVFVRLDPSGSAVSAPRPGARAARARAPATGSRSRR
jgi:hypothetical protein